MDTDNEKPEDEGKRLTEAEKQEKLDDARRLIAEVNRAEAEDSRLSWRPWQLRRTADPR